MFLLVIRKSFFFELQLDQENLKCYFIFQQGMTALLCCQFPICKSKPLLVPLRLEQHPWTYPRFLIFLGLKL